MLYFEQCKMQLSTVSDWEHGLALETINFKKCIVGKNTDTK